MNPTGIERNISLQNVIATDAFFIFFFSFVSLSVSFTAQRDCNQNNFSSLFKCTRFKYTFIYIDRINGRIIECRYKCVNCVFGMQFKLMKEEQIIRIKKRFNSHKQMIGCISSLGIFNIEIER